MWSFIRKKFIPILIVVSIVIFVMMGISNATKEQGKASLPSDALGIVLSPVQGAFSWAIGNFISIGEYIHTVTVSVEENETLKEQIVQLEQLARDAKEYKNENERLRSLLDFKQKEQDYQTVGAEVIAKEPGNWFQIFTINRGTMDGLQQGCAVIDSQGLIGYIYEIGTTWAKVATIIDPETNVGAMLTKTGEQVVVEGDMELSRDGLCKMVYIPKNANIMIGDPIETSGLGGIYPKGLFIGRIKEINTQQGELYKEVVVEPAADFQRIREVLVIKK